MAKKNNKKASKNREKKLAKRKSIQKIKKKEVNRENSSISFKHIIKELHKYPVLRSFIGDTLFSEANMGAVVLVYKLPLNKFAFLSFLTDLMGAGVKDVHFKVFTEDEYYSHIEFIENNMEIINLKPECLKFIIIQAVKKSKMLSIEQHYNFEKYFNYFYGHFDESNCDKDFAINQDEFFTEISKGKLNELNLSTDNNKMIRKSQEEIDDFFGKISDVISKFKFYSEIDDIDLLIKYWNYCIVRETGPWSDDFKEKIRKEYLPLEDETKLDYIFYIKINYFNEDLRIIDKYNIVEDKLKILDYHIDDNMILNMLKFNNIIKEQLDMYSDAIIKNEKLETEHINILYEVVKRNRGDWHYSLMLGDALFINENYQDAISFYHEVLSIDKENIYPRIRALLSFMMLGNYILMLEEYLILQEDFKKYKTKENKEQYRKFIKNFKGIIKPGTIDIFKENNLVYDKVIEEIKQYILLKDKIYKEEFDKESLDLLVSMTKLSIFSEVDDILFHIVFLAFIIDDEKFDFYKSQVKDKDDIEAIESVVKINDKDKAKSYISNFVDYIDNSLIELEIKP